MSTAEKIEDAVARLKLVMEEQGIKPVVGHRIDDSRKPCGLIMHLRLRDLPKIKSLPVSVGGFPVVAKIEDYIDFADSEQTALLCNLWQR